MLCIHVRIRETCYIALCVCVCVVVCNACISVLARWQNLQPVLKQSANHLPLAHGASVTLYKLPYSRHGLASSSLPSLPSVRAKFHRAVQYAYTPVPVRSRTHLSTHIKSSCASQRSSNLSSCSLAPLYRVILYSASYGYYHHRHIPAS